MVQPQLSPTTPALISPVESENVVLRVTMLEQTLADLHRQLTAERAHGIPTAEELAEKMAAAEGRLAAGEKEVRLAKDLAKRRKQEIDDWKQWFHTLPEEDKTDGLVTLRSEIDWRAAELAELTTQLSTLLAQQATITGEIELVKQQQAALTAGVYELPLEEDPRLRSLHLALQQAKTELSQVSHE